MNALLWFTFGLTILNTVAILTAFVLVLRGLAKVKPYLGMLSMFAPAETPNADIPTLPMTELTEYWSIPGDKQDG